jgi:hypothetical protein
MERRKLGWTIYRGCYERLARKFILSTDRKT